MCVAPQNRGSQKLARHMWISQTVHIHPRLWRRCSISLWRFNLTLSSCISSPWNSFVSGQSCMGAIYTPLFPCKAPAVPFGVLLDRRLGWHVSNLKQMKRSIAEMSTRV